jgi:hypothetical protein
MTASSVLIPWYLQENESMSWQNKVLCLVKKYGAPAKFAASTILNAVIPGSPVVIALVEQAFGAVEKTAQDDWELNLSKQVQTTAENQARLEQMLDILGSDLQHLFAQVADFERMPEIAKKLVETSQQSDARLQDAVKKLDGVAHRFDHLEELTARVLVGQQATHGKLDDLSAAVRKLIASPAAAVLAKAQQMPVSDVVLNVRRCVVDMVDSTLLLETEVVVNGDKQVPVPYRKIYFFLNSQPLASLATDDTGLACLRDPIPLADLKLQRNNVLQVRVDDSAKAASADLQVLEPADVDLEDFDPEDFIDEEETRFTRRERFAFCGTVTVKLNPANFIDVANVWCKCSVNGNVVAREQVDSYGRCRLKFRKEYTLRTFSDGDKSGEPPYSWSKRGRNKLKVEFAGLPDWFTVEMDLR